MTNTTMDARDSRTEATPAATASGSADSAAATAAGQVLEFDDIQGVALSGFGRLTHAAYLVLRFNLPTDAARAALRQTADEVTSATLLPRELRPRESLNVALTSAGLQALGLPEDALATFPPEFRGGMAEQYRARALGDIGVNAPETWQWGGPEEAGAPHLLLLCYADGEELLGGLVARLLDRWTPGAATLLADERATPNFPFEHFGFRDDITSVVIEGGYDKPAAGTPPIKAGEFLLGYENEYGLLPPSPSVPGMGADLGRNGTYLVFRKLEQDVPAFWEYCRAQADALAAPGGGGVDTGSVAGHEYIAAKMVGRWRGGAPLANYPCAPPPADTPRDGFDAFGFQKDDKQGLRCPMGAHIRRANPRDVLGDLEGAGAERVVNRHRIARRGRPYGPPYADPTAAEPDGRERGLLFLCVNADIARQFEFVQQTWLNDPKFARLWDEPDPVIGSAANIGDRGWGPDGAAFSIPQQPLRVRLKRVPQFVRVRAGGYFFVPGLRALRRIAS